MDFHNFPIAVAGNSCKYYFEDNGENVAGNVYNASSKTISWTRKMQSIKPSGSQLFPPAQLIPEKLWLPLPKPTEMLI